MAKQKVLFTASIAKHILRFHLPYLKWFQDKGFETHVACEGDEKIPLADKQWKVPFIRMPFSAGHFKVYRELKNIIDREQYALIHCHTPMASLLTRLAARDARKKGTKVLYTAHGFHFYKGAPLYYWLTYYPIELLASRWADGIITINHEDNDLIRKQGNQKTDYFLVPGVGVNQNRFFPVSAQQKLELRNVHGFDTKDFLIVYAAEFIRRKNHPFLIKSSAQFLREHPDVKILLCGRGKHDEDYRRLVEKEKLTDSMLFMGFRTDIHEIFQMSDIGISTSKQEGLAINMLEVMMCGIPVLASKIRGHVEYVEPGKTGFLYQPDDAEDFMKQFRTVYNQRDTLQKLSANCVSTASGYEIEQAVAATAAIYKRYLPEYGK
ncbi:MAG: glycosyltransferase [Flavobacterium sp.]|nr:glycosyltransferase [Flavobacterium sp.]